MRIQRCAVLNKDRAQCFHVVSRIVGRDFIFGNGEKNFMRQLMENHEGFCGVKILAFCLMGNHFHVLVHVPPKPEEISYDEIKHRMRWIYNDDQISEFEYAIEQEKLSGNPEFEAEFYEKMASRMYDISSFIRDVKQKFSVWYNKQNDRVGTLWESRFKSTLLENSPEVLMPVAAYIALNPVRAELVTDPKDYTWSSYSEAVAGDVNARSAIKYLVGGGSDSYPWSKAHNTFRCYLYVKGGEQAHKKPGFDLQTVKKVLDKGGSLSMTEILMVKIRFFSESIVMGGDSFIHEFYHSRKDKIYKRKYKISFSLDDFGLSDFHSYRNIRNP